MIQQFNNLPWHDAELKEILIDRTKNNDILNLVVSWPNSSAETTFIEFVDCYAFQADMHFGFVPPDFILEAECLSHSKELDYLKKKWEKMRVIISELYCFKIITNSTNSTINIYAKNFKISK